MLYFLARIVAGAITRFRIVRLALFARRVLVVRVRPVPGKPWAADILGYRQGIDNRNLEQARAYVARIIDADVAHDVRDEIDWLCAQAESPGVRPC